MIALGTNNRGTTQSSKRDKRSAPSLHLNANTRRSLISRGAEGLEPTTVLSELPSGDTSRSQMRTRTDRSLSARWDFATSSATL